MLAAVICFENYVVNYCSACFNCKECSKTAIGDLQGHCIDANTELVSNNTMCIKVHSAKKNNEYRTLMGQTVNRSERERERNDKSLWPKAVYS